MRLAGPNRREAISTSRREPCASTRIGRVSWILSAILAVGAGGRLSAVSSCYDVECDLGCKSAWSGLTEIIGAADYPPQTSNTTIAFIDPNDGRSHRFIASKEGRIWVWDGLSGAILPTPFLDFSSRVDSEGVELGVVAMALDPDYRTTGELYVLFTGLGDAPGFDDSIVVERYRRDPDDPERALLESHETVLVLDHQNGITHHGGSLVFGVDGFLYVSIGDAGGVCDQEVSGSPHGQRLDTLYGKVLRLDVRGVDPKALPPECGDAGSSYGIPADSPLAGAAPGCGEIWAFGFRNPYRMTTDRATGDLWIGDVGQRSWEEINFLPGDYAPVLAEDVRNFGWKCREGCATLTCSNTTTQGGPLCPETLTPGVSTCSYGQDLDPAAGVLDVWDPVLCHENRAESPIDDADWQAIVGGYRYRGSAVPDWAGAYFYGDVYCGQLWKTTHFDAADPAATTSECFDDGNSPLLSFAEDRFGELYLVYGDGRVACLHDGSGCFWADDDGLFEDGFETGDARRWVEGSKE